MGINVIASQGLLVVTAKPGLHDVFLGHVVQMEYVLTQKIQSSAANALLGRTENAVNTVR